MRTFALIQDWVVLGLSVVAFGLELWAVIDAAIRPAAGFLAAGKRTKRFWLLITLAAAVVGFISLPFGSGLLGGLGNLGLFAAFIAAAVYLVDVRPAVRGLKRPPTSSGSEGGW